jgi:7-cyano-7-deazaguanine tRNA-ribosyltransferase
VCDHQFGRGTFESIIGGEDKAAGLALNRSKNTGKLRTVHDAGGNHLLSMRAKDGLMILRKAAAVNLHGRLDAPSLRVTVKDDSVPFNREGRSVFAHFVTGCDPDIVPGDEVLVVDGDDALVAVGRAVMGAREMADFQSGVAVDVREGLAP